MALFSWFFTGKSSYFSHEIVTRVVYIDFYLILCQWRVKFTDFTLCLEEPFLQSSGSSLV